MSIEKYERELRIQAYLDDGATLQERLLPETTVHEWQEYFEARARRVICDEEWELYQLKLRQMQMWGFSWGGAKFFDYEYGMFMQRWIKVRAMRDAQQSLGKRIARIVAKIGEQRHEHDQ